MVGQRVYGKFMYLQLICCEPKIALNNKVYKKKKKKKHCLEKRLPVMQGKQKQTASHCCFLCFTCFVLVVPSWPGPCHRSRSLL